MPRWRRHPLRRSGQLSVSVLCFLLMLLLSAPSCGYRVASKNRMQPQFQTLAVRPLVNETTTFEIEQLLTRALVSEFVEKSAYAVVDDETAADAVLDGVVRRVSLSPVTFARSAFASTFLVTVQISVALRNRNSGAVIFQEENYIFREEYIINVDVENFFSEMNPALDRISRDFATSVVTSILEDF